jgi:hypothetical protein
MKPLDAAQLQITFSDEQQGIKGLSDLLDEGGPMVEPLRDPAMFRRVFVQCGVPTWPNGFDIDAIRLHREMTAAGLLEPADVQDAAE